MYTYQALITAVFDGDTCTADIDLGFGIHYTEQKMRLHGINAPEVRGFSKSSGIEARDFLISKVLNKRVTIQTFRDKQEKYGRYLAKIWIDEVDATGNSVRLCINDLLVQTGHAVYADYD